MLLKFSCFIFKTLQGLDLITHKISKANLEDRGTRRLLTKAAFFNQDNAKKILLLEFTGKGTKKLFFLFSTFLASTKIFNLVKNKKNIKKEGAFTFLEIKKKVWSTIFLERVFFPFKIKKFINPEYNNFWDKFII